MVAEELPDGRRQVQFGAPIGAVSGVDLVDTTTDVGSDDEGASTAVTLAIVGGIDSGLRTTDGHVINLYVEVNGDVTGRDGAADGTVIFAVKIDADGKVSVAQYDSLNHGVAPNNYDESLSLNGKLNAVVTVIDGDLDKATSAVAIGNLIQFQDDGPSASIRVVSEASVVLDESLGLNCAWYADILLTLTTPRTTSDPD